MITNFVCSGPENYKVNPGAVESILELSSESQLLIGYERGLVVLWDLKEQKNLRVCSCSNSVQVQTYGNVMTKAYFIHLIEFCGDATVGRHVLVPIRRR